jgi:hypothetical protein
MKGNLIEAKGLKRYYRRGSERWRRAVRRVRKAEGLSMRSAERPENPLTPPARGIYLVVRQGVSARPAHGRRSQETSDQLPPVEPRMLVGDRNPARGAT